MLTIELIGFEVLTILNYGFWFVGMITCAGLVSILAYVCFSDWSILTGEDKPVSTSEQLASTVRTTSLGAETRATSLILEQCLSHQAQLKYYHRILCERVGVEPESLSPMADLIAEAVFDGRKIPQCIYEIDLAAQVIPVPSEKREPQHA